MQHSLLKRMCPLSICTDGGLFISEISKTGIIVFREGRKEVEILLLHRKHQNDWSFPKGHVESGEGVLEAGLRELVEETDVRPMVLGRLTDLTYLDGKRRPVRVSLFLGFTDSKYTHRCSPDGEIPKWIPISKVEKTLSYENLRIYFRACILPLFAKKTGSEKAAVEIIFSAAEPYEKGARLLARTIKTSGVNSRCLELNRLAFKKKTATERRLGYFLSNATDVPNAAFWFEERGGGYVVNAEYLRFWHSKSTVQAMLERHGIPTLLLGPRNAYGKKLEPSFMIKSEKHGLRDAALVQRMSERAPWGVYAERKMDDAQFVEMKIGYVAGQIFTENMSFAVSSTLRGALHRIQDCIGLEIFSADIFTNSLGEFFVIDVNPAPAFFHNEEARRAFGCYVRIVSRMCL